MAERIGKTGLNAGASWNLFAENTAFEDSEGMRDKRRDTETTRLHKEDMKVFGLCPARDNLSLAMCKECQKAMLLPSLHRHYELKHRKLLSTLRSPTRRCPVTKPSFTSPTAYGKSKLLKSPGDNSFIRIEEVDPTDMNVKIEEAPLNIPKFNHASKAKLPKINLKGLMSNSKQKNAARESTTPPPKQPSKRVPCLKDREYDPEKHCGVMIVETEKRCTRSLTCKTHSLSLRRAVPCRSKSFDELLAEHKARSHNSKESNSSTPTATPTHSPTKCLTPTFPVVKLERLELPSKSSSAKEPSKGEDKRRGSIDDFKSNSYRLQQETVTDLLLENPIGSSNLPTISYHPRPLMVNGFGSRRTQRGCPLFHRKLDHFRWATNGMVKKFINPNLQIPNSQASVPFRVVPGPDGLCTVQVVGRGSGPASTTPVQTVPIINPPYADTTITGPVPKVKTKGGKPHVGVKRQFSLSSNIHSSDSHTHKVPRKRSHSVDLSKLEPSNEVNGISNLTNNNHLNPDNALNIESLANLENSPLELSLNAVSSTLLANNINRTSSSTFTISGATVSSSNLNTSLNLNSSLNLCQTMGINPGISQTQMIVDQSQLPVNQTKVGVNHMVAPNVSVTQGMMVSLPSVTQVTNVNVFQSNLKEILPAPSSGRSIAPSPTSGLYTKSQGLSSPSQSPLPNGTGPSPPPNAKNYGVSYGSVQGVHTVALSTGTGSIGTVLPPSPVTYGKKQRVSHLVVRQPNQRDQFSQRTNSFTKPSLPSQQQQVQNSSSQVVQNLSSSLSSQIQTVASTVVCCSPQKTLLNTPQYSVSQQPSNSAIAQLKQMQLQQRQQQQQFQQQQVSPLNSIKVEPMTYQQQILPKLTVASGATHMVAQGVNPQTLHVTSFIPQGQVSDAGLASQGATTS